MTRYRKILMVINDHQAKFCSSFNPACPALSKVPHVLVLRRGWLALREANLKIGFCTNRHGQFHLGHTIQRPCFSYILEENIFLIQALRGEQSNSDRRHTILASFQAEAEIVLRCNSCIHELEIEAMMMGEH
ncbi:hypothetical protein P8452_00399 [Trifolium repens]|nr:hypothetical protein P8452_00399 [Trifolium repens]